MMDKETYDRVRQASSGLFNNGLVLPVALAISTEVNERATFSISDLRVVLGGRGADNQIRDALKRLAAAEAIHLLASLGPPNPNLWERRPHPFWAFVEEWMESVAQRREA